MVYCEGEKKYKCWLSTKMIVTKFLMYEDSNQKYLKITATTKFGIDSKEIPCSWLNKKDLVQILCFGWNFDEKFAYQLIRYLVKAAEDASCVIRYDRVGWFEYNNELLFRTNRIITDDKKIFNLYQ